MTGIVGYATYLPRHRLRAADIGQARGEPPAGAGERRVAGFDEDALTMAVEAGRLLRRATPAPVQRLAFCTTTPPYAGKNNASAAHGALGLPDEVAGYDLGGAHRSALGLLTAAPAGTLLLAGDLTLTRPGEPDETDRGDGAAAVLFGPAEQAVAELVATASSTEELLDHWRDPARPTATSWEERFGAARYLRLLDRTLARLPVDAADHVVVSSPNPRAARLAARRLARFGPDCRLGGVGHAGAADPLLQLGHALDVAAPGETILLASLADGCDLLVLRGTDRLASGRAAPAAAAQLAAAQSVSYLDYLTWRGLVDRAGPRRPEPAPVSAPASARNAGWKYALRAARCAICGCVQAPPQRVCVRCGAAGTGTPVPLSELGGTVRTFSVDRLADRAGAPMVAAVVDFDGGGRLELELAAPVTAALRVGARVRMTFRRRPAGGGVPNYAWKALLQEGSDE